MVQLAFVLALASRTSAVFFARDSTSDSPGDGWFLNVTVGGIFDEIPQCSKTCTLAYLEVSGCDPLDTACFCPITDIAVGLDQCLASFCPVLEYYGPQLQIEIIVVAVIALIAVILRFITRLPPLSIKWGADDWLVAILALLGAGYLATFILAIDSGLGQDAWLLSPQKVADVVKYYSFEELGYVAITFLTKITILTFYLRIFPLGRIRISTYLFIGVCVCLMISIFLAHLLQCLPISFTWDSWQGPLVQHPPDASCDVKRENLNYAFGITNITLDAIIMALPIPKLLSLELRWQRKLGVILVFCVGFILLCLLINYSITGIGIARLVILLRSDYTNNTTFSSVRPAKWSGIEAFLSIAITCFPQIHLLGKRIIGSKYKHDHSNQPSKPSFVSSNVGIFQLIKARATYENIELGQKHLS
ncbi:cfem domain-containing [Pyrenophora seminiperda CCB06]|uniref:Cfem domain-containing n=1 Tax=Pyrenophora seminiperda CCB06 TaxID=1302712 RepID=A0A3M7LVP0_9PLEO|nr:cfem domain-containing [Pyrenophora seminiperda CCB06]